MLISVCCCLVREFWWSKTRAPIIYVVDDDEAVRDSLKLLLEIHGMVVEVYRSSEEFARSYVPGRGV